MARKKGKLPGKVVSKTYSLEYNTATIELPAFVVKKGMRVVLIDDLLATGGTLEAVKELVEEQGGNVVGIVTMIELSDLNGRKVFKDTPYKSLLPLLGA
jgi:adenine phosphoribosyltransferase